MLFCSRTTLFFSLAHDSEIRSYGTMAVRAVPTHGCIPPINCVASGTAPLNDAPVAHTAEMRVHGCNTAGRVEAQRLSTRKVKSWILLLETLQHHSFFVLFLAEHICALVTSDRRCPCRRTRYRITGDH